MSVLAKATDDRSALTFAIRLSLATGILMFVVKVSAYLLTGSAAILSDAAESVVHVVAVAFAAYSLKLSYKPADESHLYGHTKISFFSAGFEGAMIFLAGLFIIYESITKWMTGLHLENLGIGTGLTAFAAAINAALGLYLVRLGTRRRSLILKADGHHVLTDVWTSLGVLVALALTWTTGWLPFDPVCGIIMALNIIWSGAGLIRSAFAGLMDAADPAVHKQLTDILDRETDRRGLAYHELRHRNVGDSHWIEVHLVFPENVPVGTAHREATEIERVIEEELQPQAHVTTHLESGADHAVLHPEG